jgi:cytochrome c-type biogenesis protein CcmE
VTTTTASPPAPPAPPPRSPRRLRYLVAAGLCVVAIGALLFLGLRGNIVYFRTVSEAVKSRQSEGTHRFRLAGAVVPGSIAQTARGVRFDVTDGKQTVTVDHVGDPPDLFKAKVPVVCEGRWGRGLVFDSDRILIKHGSQYTPPKVKVKANTESGNSS